MNRTRLHLGLALATFCATAIALIACSSNQVTNLQNELTLAKQGEDIVIRNTDLALRGGQINAVAAKSVSAIAHQVDPLMQAMHESLAAADVAGATKTMQLINALLAGLNAFIPPAPPGAPVPTGASP